MRDKYGFLFLGDIIGRPGRRALKKFLPTLLEKYSPSLVVANGENAAGMPSNIWIKNHGFSGRPITLLPILERGFIPLKRKRDFMWLFSIFRAGYLWNLSIVLFERLTGSLDRWKTDIPSSFSIFMRRLHRKNKPWAGILMAECRLSLEPTHTCPRPMKESFLMERLLSQMWAWSAGMNL
jgi:hypothetical protein